MNGIEEVSSLQLWLGTVLDVMFIAIVEPLMYLLAWLGEIPSYLVGKDLDPETRISRLEMLSGTLALALVYVLVGNWIRYYRK